MQSNLLFLQVGYRNQKFINNGIKMMPQIPQIFLLCALLAPRPIVGFTVGAPTTSSGSNTALQSAISTQDDLLKPPYEIEPISIRIGHGFDIHRMAPLEEAGQPVVIGGVEIPHKDQKVNIASIARSLRTVLQLPTFLAVRRKCD